MAVEKRNGRSMVHIFTSSSLHFTSISQPNLRPRAVEALIIRDRKAAEDGEAAGRIQKWGL